MLAEAACFYKTRAGPVDAETVCMPNLSCKGEPDLADIKGSGGRTADQGDPGHAAQGQAGADRRYYGRRDRGLPGKQPREENGVIAALEGLQNNVLKYYLAGSWIAIRPSGTEPKCTFYYCIKGASAQDAEAKTEIMQKAIADLVA